GVVEVSCVVGLEVVAADRGVYQQAYLVRDDPGVGQRLHAGQGGGVGGLHVAVPQAPGVDAGDVVEDVELDPEPVEGGLEPGVDLIARQPARGVDVGEAGNGDVLEQHGWLPEAGTKEESFYRLPARGAFCATAPFSFSRRRRRSATPRTSARR